MAELYQITEESLEMFRPMLTDQSEYSFLSDPDILGVGAVDREEACGVMLLKLSEAFIYLTYIAVSDAYRKRGIATALLRFAKDMALKNGKVLYGSFFAADENEPIYRLFKTMPAYAVQSTGRGVYRVPAALLLKVRDRLPALKSSLEAEEFESLGQEERNAVFKKLKEEGVYYFDPTEENYISPLCLVVKKENEVKGVLLTRVGEEPGEVVVNYIYGADPKSTTQMFLSAAEKAGELFGQINAFRFICVNEESESLVQKIFPEAECRGLFYEFSVDI